MRADVSLAGMHAIAYDAVNLTAPEFYFGLNYIRDMATKLAIPFVSANLIASEAFPQDWFKPYLIQKIGGMRVAITGVLSPQAFQSLPTANTLAGFQVMAPRAALERWVPELRRQADVVVLLSHLDPQETTALATDISGIDIAIAACDANECEAARPAVAAGPAAAPLLLCAQKKGLSLEVLRIRKTTGRNLAIVGSESIPLDDAVLHDPAIDDLVTNAYRERRRKEIEHSRAAQHQQLLKGLDLSPHDFMQQQQETAAPDTRRAPHP